MKLRTLSEFTGSANVCAGTPIMLVGGTGMSLADQRRASKQSHKKRKKYFTEFKSSIMKQDIDFPRNTQPDPSQGPDGMPVPVTFKAIPKYKKKSKEVQPVQR